MNLEEFVHRGQAAQTAADRIIANKVVSPFTFTRCALCGAFMKAAQRLPNGREGGKCTRCGTEWEM